MVVSKAYWDELNESIKYLELEKKHIEFSLRVLKQELTICASGYLEKLEVKNER